MRDKYVLLDIRLDLFDGGEGAGSAPGAGEPGAAASAAPAGRDGGKPVVLYGKQPAQEPPAAPETPPPAEKTPEEKRKAFRELVRGEYKDQYAEDTQRIIDRRFKETEGLRQQLGKYQPVIDMLMQRYGIADGDVGRLTAALDSDNAYWAQAAESAGMSVDQFKRFQQLQRENAQLREAERRAVGRQNADRQLQTWYAQAEEARKTYPHLDLQAEARDPQFLSMLRAGVPVLHAYEVLHMDDIKAGVAAMQAKATEKQVAANIKARGTRPQENGAGAQSGFLVKDDVSKLTKEDVLDILDRVAKGEKISF